MAGLHAVYVVAIECRGAERLLLQVKYLSGDSSARIVVAGKHEALNMLSKPRKRGLKKLRLGLDLDGCLYRWGEFPGESLDYDWIKNHVTPESWQWLWTEGVEKHGLFRYGSLYKGTRQLLEVLEPLYDSVIITSRPSSAVHDTLEWLSFQKIPTSEIHVVGVGKPKSQIQPECDVYLDDAVHNCEDLLINTAGLVVMPDRPWNQKFEAGPWFDRFHRTYSVAHTKHVLETYHKQKEGL
jgi:uncharacterized HAD superfamily protein